MQTHENGQSCGRANGMHLVSCLACGMRGPAFVGNAAGQTEGGVGCTGNQAWQHRRTQEGHDRDSLSEANRILDAALDGHSVTKAEIDWALRETGDL